MTPGRPLSFAAAVAGSLAVTGVACFFLFDALRPMEVGRAPDAVGIVLALAILAYVASVWAVASGRFGPIILLLHLGLALLLLAGTAVLGVVGFALLVSGRCGLAAGMGLFGAASAILLALGLVPAEIYCLGRRHAG